MANSSTAGRVQENRNNPRTLEKYQVARVCVFVGCAWVATQDTNRCSSSPSLQTAEKQQQRPWTLCAGSSGSSGSVDTPGARAVPRGEAVGPRAPSAPPPAAAERKQAAAAPAPRRTQTPTGPARVGKPTTAPPASRANGGGASRTAGAVSMPSPAARPRPAAGTGVRAPFGCEAGRGTSLEGTDYLASL
jgi:hypothetical protein